MATSYASSILIFVFILIVPSVKPQAKPVAPPPVPAADPTDLKEILEKGSQFSTLIDLMENQVFSQVKIQLNSSREGLTVIAPTDNAFHNLKSGSLNGLTTQQQNQLLLNHITPKYYAKSDLLSVSNPVRTLASGQDGKPFGLNFTGHGNQANVSTGLSMAQINNALREEFPLAVYVVESVLLPTDLFGSAAPEAKAPTASPKSPVAPAPETPPSDGETPPSDAGTPAPAAEDKPKSASAAAPTGTAGFGLVLGLAWLCFNLLSA